MINKSKVLLVAILSTTALTSYGKLQTFTGTYAGAVGAIGSTSITVDNTNTTPDTRYKISGSTYSMGGLVGIGRAWQRMYLGFEGSVGYNGGKVKKNEGKLTHGFNFDVAARIGRPVHEASIMPYLRMALTYQKMTFNAGADHNFHTYGLQPSLGFETIVDPVWRIRAEVGYNIGIHSTNLPSQYKIKRKPSSFIGSIGVTRKLSD